MSSFIDQANEAIRLSGGRITDQREIIISLLEAAHSQIDADTLHTLARRQDSNISLATVYRTLHVLEGAGLVQARYRSTDHEHKFYELVGSGEIYHFTCRKCHQVIPFRSALIADLKHKLAAELGISVLDACMCLNGICAACEHTNQYPHAEG